MKIDTIHYEDEKNMLYSVYFIDEGNGARTLCKEKILIDKSRN